MFFLLFLALKHHHIASEKATRKNIKEESDYQERGGNYSDLKLIRWKTQGFPIRISKIKCSQNKTLHFGFPTAKVEDINKTIKSLNPRKATGPDGIPVKMLKSARNIIDAHPTNIINRDI